MKWFRQHIGWANVLVVVVEVIIAGIIWYSGDWFFAGSKETFGSLHGYFFIWIPVIIATVAALNSVFASINARDSFTTTARALEFTRATQRPFLNTYDFDVNWTRNDGQPTSVGNFRFGFHNKGAFPADQVSVLMKVSKKEIDDKQYLFTASEGITPLCFPTEEITNLVFTEVAGKEKLEVEPKGELKVRIEIKYKDKLTQETHKTNRSYLVQYNPSARHGPIPLPKEDDWD